MMELESTKNAIDSGQENSSNNDQNIKSNMYRTTSWTPKKILFLFCWISTLHGFIINGIVNVNMSSIEKRYKLNSKETGFIASCDDIASLLIVIPLSYFGSYMSKPRFITIGIVVLVFGSLVFASPHMFGGKYEFLMEEKNLCPLTKSPLCPEASSISNYKYIFFFGNFLVGIGGIPMYTIGISYIDSTVSKNMSSLYNGIYSMFGIMGAFLGFLVGSRFLNFYVDFLSVDHNELGLPKSSTAWCGAWWLGFIIAAIVGLILIIPTSLLPDKLPVEENDKEVGEAHVDIKDFIAIKKGLRTELKDLPKTLFGFAKNPSFIFLMLADSGEALIISALTTFLPKIIEQQFSMTASKASILVGGALIPAAIIGTFLGGYIIQKLELNFVGIIKMCVICSTIAVVTSSVLIFNCANLNFIGKTAPYTGDTKIQEGTFNSRCNSHCSCSEYTYDPICSVDNSVYFSPCFAGCQDSSLLDGKLYFTNCSCLRNVTAGKHWIDQYNHMNGIKFKSEAVRDNCHSDCNLLVIFLIFTFIPVLFSFIMYMPTIIATLRCVTERQKTLALGIKSLSFRLFGTIPAPLLFGLLIDSSCILWDKSCKDITGSCILYDNTLLSRYVFSLTVVLKGFSLIFFALTWYFYKEALPS